MSIYYASNTGGGTGLLQGSPFRISNFIALAVAGDQCYLLNGTYTGANSMITVVTGSANNGTSGNPITISALNDGQVFLDGQNARQPIYLAKKFWIVEGVNAGNSNGEVVSMVGESNIVRRCGGWDGDASANIAVFHIYNGQQFSGNPDETGSNNLGVDCFGFGTGRKVFEISAGAATSTYRRCFAVLAGSNSTAGPRCAFDIGYSSLNDTAENCIATVDEEYSTDVADRIGTLFSLGRTITGECDQHQLYLGCIGYLLASQTRGPSDGGLLTGLRPNSWFECKDVVIYIEPGSHTDVSPFNFLEYDPAGAGGCPVTPDTANQRKLTRVAQIGATQDNTVGTDNVSDTDIVKVNFSHNATVAALYGAESIYDNDGTKPTVRYRYQNGTLTATELWPWPMNQRIIDGMTLSGRTPIDVGAVIQSVFGTFPNPGDPGDPGDPIDPVDPEDPPTIPPPEDPEVIGTVASGREWHTLARIFLDTGTLYYSKKQIDHPAYVYEGRIKSFGHVDRSIPVPCGLPQQGDCLVQIIDTDMALRDVLAHQTPLRRFIELRNVPEGGSESAHPPFATLEIFDFELHDGLVEIHGRDTTFSWFDKPIPGLINRTNFPDLMEGIDEAFMPIICGVLDAPSDASPPNPQGVLTLPRMTFRRWGLAQHPILYVELCGRVDTSTEFTLIDPADYTITEEPHTIDGVSHTLSFVDFDVDQDLALEVRCRIVEGFYTRGEFGDLPARINSPLTALRNPVDAWINVNYTVLARETRLPSFDTASFLTVLSLMDSAFITSVSPAEPYACDFAITQPITAREFNADWCTSFEIDLFVNRYGQIAMNVTHEEDPDRPVFSQGPVYGEDTDNSLILLNSVRQRAANPVCNQLRYQFGENYSTTEFLYNDIFNNTDDQEALGSNTSPLVPEVITDTVQFKHVREPNVAEDVARRRMEFLALGSYRIELKLPLPIVYNNLELAKQVGITSQWGLAVGGYDNAEVKTTGLTYELDSKLTTLRGILRVPQTVDQEIHGELLTGESYIETLDFGLGSSATAESGYARSLFMAPWDGYADSAEYYLEFNGQNIEGVALTWTLVPIDPLSNVGTGGLTAYEPVGTIEIPAGFTGRVRNTERFFFDPRTVLYALIAPQVAVGNNTIAYRIRVAVRQTTVDKTVSEVRLSSSSGATALDQTIGGGDIFRTLSKGDPNNTVGFISVGGPRWTFDATAWDAVQYIVFYAVLANASFDQETRYSEGILWDLDDDAAVGLSRLTFQQDIFLAPRLGSTSFGAESLTHGHTYEVRIRCVHDPVGAYNDFNTYFHKARLLIYIDPIRSVEFHHRIGNSTGPPETRGIYGTMTPEASVHYEVHSSGAQTDAVSDLGASDTTTTGSAVSASTPPTVDDLTLQSRTDDIESALTAGNRYGVAGLLQASFVYHVPPTTGPASLAPNMDAREDFLAVLVAAGFTPNRAMLLREGTGNPVEHYTQVAGSLSGSPEWRFDRTYGMYLQCSATSKYIIFPGASNTFLSTSSQTVLIIRRKQDTTARASGLFGVDDATANTRCSAHVPFNDNTAYWDFGGATAPNRTSRAFTITTDLEALAFVAGTTGSALWRDGVEMSGSSATLITRTGSTGVFRLNQMNGTAGDLQDIFLCIVIPSEVDDATLALFTVDNVLLG